MFLQFYGLSEQPFGVTPDPRFLYMGTAHHEAFQSLTYGIETGCGFMVLVAAPGLGKTTMLFRLMEKLRDSALTAFLFQIHTSSQEFLKNLLRDLDVEPTGQDMSDLQGQLHAVLMRGSQSGKRVVLVIDEAQNLDDSLMEMIRTLSNFETPQTKLLQIILVGQPALANKLVRPHLAQLRQRLSIITQLTPFRGSEVEKYIHHRLHVAGYQGDGLFTHAAMALIADHSGGAPRVINNLCFNALSSGHAKGQRKIDESILREVIAGLNLESLGKRLEHARRGATQSAPALRDVKNIETASLGGPETHGPDLDISSPPFEAVGSPMGRVDISDFAPEGRGRTNDRPLSASCGAASGGRKLIHRPEVLALIAIAVVAVCMWTAPSLLTGLKHLERTAGIAPDKLEAPGSVSIGNRPGTTPPPQGARVLERGADSTPGDKIDLSNTSKSSTLGIVADAAAEGSSVENSAISPHVGDRADLHAGAVVKTILPSSKTHEVNGQIITPSGRDVDDAGARGVQGKLIVQSSESGASISINGRSHPTWVTPHLFSLVAGSYIISVSKGGYLIWTKRLHVDEGQEKWAMADLVSSDPEGGIFTVDTEPAGMQVFIDGKPYGASRMETVLRAGWHVCAVIPGNGLQPLVRQFHLNSGEALTRRIRLTSTPISSSPTTKSQPNSTDMLGVSPKPQGDRLE